MKKLLVFTLMGFCACVLSAQTITHDLDVTIQPELNYIEVADIFSLPAEMIKDDKLEFYLNGNLELKFNSKKAKYSVSDIPGAAERFGFPINKYTLELAKSKTDIISVSLSYQGRIKQEVSQGIREKAGAIGSTSGIISDVGIYLSESSYWVPGFDNNFLSTFSLKVKIDKDWSIVSQGSRTEDKIKGDTRHIKYESRTPGDGIYLIGAKWEEYFQQYGDINIQAFLRTPDKELADKYIQATADYIQQYDKLIGPYPYSKFALLENFWESGFGMPSFTLLGERIIRFPWIIETSYPHELLHNYWGNSVYVDHSQGNWCEGLTSYMADHLIKEQKGQADEYRRTTLQNYTDYVNDQNEYSLSEFHSRTTPADEAIGYGKCMMMNEMLRHKLGDEIFIESYSRFYEKMKFRQASFDDIRLSFEEVSGKDLKPFFDQWVNLKGAPEIKLKNISVSQSEGKYHVSFKLEQKQKGDVFDLLIPTAFYLEGSDPVIENLVLDQRESAYTFSFIKRPVKMEVDPQYNLFRRLDKKEVPATISQLTGSKDGIVILPQKSEHLKEYREMAFTWSQIMKSQGKNLELSYDSNTDALPSDKTVWILGEENKFAEVINDFERNISYLPSQDIQKIEVAKESGSLVITMLNPTNPNSTLGFLTSKIPSSLGRLGSKILRYGKYGYLAFEGPDATNTLSGVMPIIDSPLKHFFEYDGETFEPISGLPLRKALVYPDKQ